MNTNNETSSSSRPVAIVTGATGIIGPALCDRLTKEGWAVAACGSSEKSFIEHRKVTGQDINCATQIYADLSKHDECVAIVQSTQERLGPVKLLINNATANDGRRLYMEATPDFLERMVDVNFLAPIYLAQACYEDLKKTRGGVINIGSVQSLKLMHGKGIYASLKAALEKMTETMALEWGLEGIRVNSIRVGSVPGDAFLRPVLKQLPEEQAMLLRKDILPRHISESGRSSLVGRAGLPEDIANAVAFLISDQASFVQGAVIPVDGGFVHNPEAYVSKSSWNRQDAIKEWLSEKGINITL